MLRMNKESKKYLKEEPDTIKYSIGSDGNFCTSFVNMNWEGTFIVFNNSGKMVHTIICINPEMPEFNSIYDQITNNNYSISEISSPYGPILKNITPSATWFEVFVDKQADDEYAPVLIFDRKLKKLLKRN